MDKQTELKAKIGECQFRLEQLQAEANKVSEIKNQATQALMQELRTEVAPGVTSVNQTGGITAKNVNTKPKLEVKPKKVN